MFPLNFNFPFRKSNGELTTLGRMFENAGGSYTLPTAGAETKGGIKVGSGLTMDGETLNNDNPTPYTLPTAGAETKGGVKVGSGLTMNGDTLNNDNPTPYTLPTASAETKGGVKVGSGLTMNGEILANSAINYSTNETVVGTWIDGKRIYRVVKSTIGVADIDLSSYNIKDLISVRCSMTQSSGNRCCFPYTPNTSSAFDNYVISGYLTSNNIWKLEVGSAMISNLVNSTLYTIFEYTKN